MAMTTLPAIAATRRFLRALGMTGARFTSTSRHRGKIAANPHNCCGEEQNHEDDENERQDDRTLPAAGHISRAERGFAHGSTEAKLAMPSRRSTGMRAKTRNSQRIEKPKS